MIAQTTDLDAFDLVVFGGTGDLARRKLIPALFHRELEDQLIVSPGVVYEVA